MLVLTPMQLLAQLCGSAKERRAIVLSPTMRKCGHREKATPVQSPVKWADLLKRAWGLGALACNKCKGRKRVMAIIVDADEVKRFLAHLGNSTVFERAGPRDHESDDVDGGPAPEAVCLA